MMKNMHGKIAGLALGLAILAACNNGLEAPRLEGEAGTGTVSISIEGASPAARTLAPALESFTQYVASFSGPAVQPDVAFTTDTKSVNLAPGSWTITVTAYTGTADSYTAVGRGSAAVTAVADQIVDVPTTITPITGGGRTGTLRYSVSFPAADTASLKLTNLTGDAPPVSFDLNTAATGDVTNLDTGFYLLRISLVQGGKTTGKTDVVHIYKGLTAYAMYTFAGTDFGTPVTGISLDWTGPAPAVAAGDTVALTAAIEPANATNKTVVWTSDDPDVATVDVDGTVTGVGPGTAVITAASEDGGEEATITVTVIVPVTNITGVAAEGTAGTPLTLSGTVAPVNATNKTISSWAVKSQGDTGATITGNTTLNTTEAGTVTVTATVANGIVLANNTLGAYTQDFEIVVGVADGTVNIIIDGANPFITGSDGTNDIYKNGIPSSFTLTATGYTDPFWYVDGAGTGTPGSSIVIEAANYTAQPHYVTFKGIKDGVPYSSNHIPFMVHDTP